MPAASRPEAASCPLAVSRMAAKIACAPWFSASLLVFSVFRPAVSWAAPPFASAMPAARAAAPSFSWALPSCSCAAPSESCAAPSFAETAPSES